jgi:hypothetical protein
MTSKTLPLTRCPEHLNAMNSLPGARPWRLTFSYGRALQDPALTAWGGGMPSDIGLGQRALYRRARCNSAASLGKYDASMENDGDEIKTRAKPTGTSMYSTVKQSFRNVIFL